MLRCVSPDAPALNSLDEVTKFSKGRLGAPDAKPIHVGHVPWLRGTYKEEFKFLSVSQTESTDWLHGNKGPTDQLHLHKQPEP